MRRPKGIPINYSLTRAILDILNDFGESLTIFETPYAHIKRLHREALGIPQPPKWKYKRAIKYLEYRGQLKIVEKRNKLFLKLTRNGKLNALLSKLQKDFKSNPSQWDGKWRLVIWDIPEITRPQRDYLRAFFKDLGFYQLQLSVFITPYPLPYSAVEYLRRSKLLKYIRFLRVDQIDNDKLLKKHFSLKSKRCKRSKHFSLIRSSTTFSPPGKEIMKLSHVAVGHCGGGD